MFHLKRLGVSQGVMLPQELMSPKVKPDIVTGTLWAGTGAEGDLRLTSLNRKRVDCHSLSMMILTSHCPKLVHNQRAHTANSQDTETPLEMVLFCAPSELKTV